VTGTNGSSENFVIIIETTSITYFWSTLCFLWRNDSPDLPVHICSCPDQWPPSLALAGWVGICLWKKQLCHRLAVQSAKWTKNHSKVWWRRMEVVTALLHLRLGEVLICVWTVEKRRTRWRAKELAARQPVGEKKHDSGKHAFQCEN
jgi:hypothetical protein